MNYHAASCGGIKTKGKTRIEATHKRLFGFCTHTSSLSIIEIKAVEAKTAVLQAELQKFSRDRIVRGIIAAQNR